MTELETLERAKMYIEKLANGINPIDGLPVPDDDVVNHVKLSRCLFYVADVLRQVIDNGGAAPKKKPKKAPFFLSVEKRNAFEYSAMPMPISEVSRRINALIDDQNMSTMSYRGIRDWLMSVGMLEEVLDGDGKSTKRPTPQGENVGIGLENRTGLNGTHVVVVYNLAAQHFILDNLDAIVDFERTKKENMGKPWTPEHDSSLRDLYDKGVPIDAIAITLKRNGGAVRARLKKIGFNQ